MTDTQRLDWLERNHGEVAIWPDRHDGARPDAGEKCWRVVGEYTVGSTKTLREAVDKAAASESAFGDEARWTR